MVAPDGTPVNAVKGLLEFIAHLVTVRRPTHLVACMDADWRPAWRVAAVPTYKTHRVADGDTEIVPDPLSVQVPLICDALDAFGFAWVGVAGYEADDVIGTLAARARRPVDVVTGDRDLFQTIDDRRDVRVLYIAKGVGRHEVIDEAAVAERYRIPGTAYADYALLRGDPSDGLPGAVGIGEKTAATLISRYGTIGAVLDAAADPGSDMAAAVRRKVLGSREYLLSADPVVRIATHLEIPPLDDALPMAPADPAAVVHLADRLALDATCNRMLAALAPANGAAG
jgi:5'-3' exonuclease